MYKYPGMSLNEDFIGQNLEKQKKKSMKKM